MEHFTQASRVVNEIQESLFPKLDFCTDENQAQNVEVSIDEKIRELEKLVERTEMTLQKATPAQRSTIKFKCDQIRYDYNHVKSTFRTLQNRRQVRERQRKEKEELLTRRFTTNDAMRASGEGGGGDTEISMQHQEYYDNEKSKLHGFHSHVDELLATGAAAISNLRDQGSALRTTRSKIMEVGNTLGLSNSVMRLVEKRILTDKFILFGGMFIFTFLMFLIWKFLT